MCLVFGWALKAKVHLYKGELDSALNAGLEVLKSTYHKLWDMRPMYYDVVAELPFMDFMSTGWDSYAIHPKADPENLLYQFCNNDNGEPFPFWIRKETLDLFDKQKNLLQKINLQNVVIRAQVDNPFYWAANDEGIDPESFNANEGTRTQFMMPTYSVGLNINF